MRNRTITRETWRAETFAQGITLVELARRTGVSTRAIYAYASGSRRPTDEWVQRVETVLAVIDEARVAPQEGAA